MFIDLGESGQDLDLTTDLCVIGGGEAGLTIAHELQQSGLRICVVETGGFDRDPACDGLNNAETDGSPTLDFRTTRPRVLGGSTAEWGGMCCPLDICDFETRPSMPLHGWPISLADLQPYYRRAHTALGLGPLYFDERLWSVLGIPPPAVDPQRLRTMFWQYRSMGILPTDSPLRFGRAYRADFLGAADHNAVLNATVVDLSRSPGQDRVGSVELRSIGGRRGRVRASTFVLAGGCVENTRLLLSSDFSSCSDALGRYFMEHPHMPVGTISYDDMHRVLPKWAVLQRSRHMSLRPKFLPTPNYQRERDILNASMALEVRCPADCAHRALSEIKSSLRDGRVVSGLARSARRLATNPTTIAAATYRRSRGSDVCPGHDRLELYCRSEQEPNSSSRIVLARDRDALGVHRARISWRLTDRDRRTVVDFTTLVASELRRLGAANLVIDGWVGPPGLVGTQIRGGAPPHVRLGGHRRRRQALPRARRREPVRGRLVGLPDWRVRKSELHGRRTRAAGGRSHPHAGHSTHPITPVRGHNIHGW